jgi:DNA-binding PadR family transcriptional regulator
VPLDALDNPLVLPLLGLLIEQPAHAYALAQRLAERYPQLEVRRSSVTTLVGSLAAAGLISAQRPRRVGRRPARVAFALTEAGYGHVRARVAADIVAARAGSMRFTLALSYIGVLTRSAAAGVLRQRLAVLRPEFQSLSTQPVLPEFQMLEVAYWQAMVRAEIGWVEELQKRLVADVIDWPRHRPHAKGGTR